MADTAVAGGLMTHQKDEHDIWICKECGWKYPNAKPSPKIRKNHKKSCPGKAGAVAHAAGGSSDDASDDNHHLTHQGSVESKETAGEGSVAPVESQSRDLNFATLKEDLQSEAAPAEASVVNGAAKEDPATKESAVPPAVPVSSGLMPHQKDEHDVWICKECGWKYPNAKPSPKIRKNHRKHCPGRGGPVAAGGSSDEASDGEHHHAPVVPVVTNESGLEESDSTAAAPAEAPTSTSREIDFAALKESPGAEVTETTPTTEAGNGTKVVIPAASELPGSKEAVPQETPIPETVAPEAGAGSSEAGNDNKEFAPAVSGLPGSEKAVSQETANPETVAHEAGAGSGLMVHQKNEFDIWICKDCGWKYPNAKPSPKIRKTHKKKCPGSTTGRAPITAGSSDEASDAEHDLSSPAGSAAVEIPPAVESGKEDPAAAAEVPGSISREVEFAALKESPNPVTEETPAAITGETTSALPAKTHTEDAGAVSLQEVIRKDTDKAEESPTKPVSLQEAIDDETEKEKESVQSTGGSGGLLPHQKDESDVWVCKDCRWKYPDPKPSSKIIDNHKIKCPGSTGNGAPLVVASSDEALDDEPHSFTESATEKDVKNSIPAAVATGTQVTSKEFSLKDALQTSEAAPATEEKATETDDPTKGAETEQAPPTTIGGLMLHQKDEADVWVCKDCGWRYPNAKPSPKVRKSHKKKCPKRGEAAKNTSGVSSDGSSDNDAKMKGGKCFPCL